MPLNVGDIFLDSSRDRGRGDVMRVHTRQTGYVNGQCIACGPATGRVVGLRYDIQDVHARKLTDAETAEAIMSIAAECEASVASTLQTVKKLRALASYFFKGGDEGFIANTILSKAEEVTTKGGGAKELAVELTRLFKISEGAHNGQITLGEIEDDYSDEDE